MSTQQQDPYWNAGATEIQQLSPDGLDNRQNIEPQPTSLKVFRPELHKSEARPAGMQLKRAATLLTLNGLTTKQVY